MKISNRAGEEGLKTAFEESFKSSSVAVVEINKHLIKNLRTTLEATQANVSPLCELKRCR